MTNMYSTKNRGSFPEKITITKKDDLRYGENPYQPASMYDNNDLLDLTELKTGKQGLSATNIMDITRAIEILKFFSNPACAVMKHAIPSGFSIADELLTAYKNARDTDFRASFGSVVVFNKKVNLETAQEINKTFVEVVSAPGFEKEAEEELSKKKNIRLIQFSGMQKLPRFIDEQSLDEIRTLPGAKTIVQKSFLTKIKETKSFEQATTKKPSDKELNDLLTSWYVSFSTRSNSVVIVKDGTTLAVGSGQQERVGAVEQAVIKAYQKAMDRENIEYDSLNVMQSVHKLTQNPLQGAVCASDGFFPFRDSIDILAKQGITAVVQPGGSQRDEDVIKAADENNISMVFTKERCFGHF